MSPSVMKCHSPNRALFLFDGGSSVAIGACAVDPVLWVHTHQLSFLNMIINIRYAQVPLLVNIALYTWNSLLLIKFLPNVAVTLVMTEVVSLSMEW